MSRAGERPADRRAGMNRPGSRVSGTTVRFLLLMILALATAAMVYPAALSVLGGAERQELSARCRLESGILSAEERVTSAARDNGVSASYQAYHACNAPNERADRARALLGILVVGLGAGAIFQLQPGYKIRRQRLHALRRQDDPELLDQLDELVRTAGLRRSPRFLVDPVGKGAGGLAFGRLGQRYVRLDAGLLALRGGQPERFRATVLHELAHVRNGDVEITGLTLALVRGLVAFAFGPLLLADGVTLLTRGGGATGLLGVPLLLGGGTLWRAAVLAVLVVLARNSVLHAREVEADATAARWSRTAPATGPAPAAPASPPVPPPIPVASTPQRTTLAGRATGWLTRLSGMLRPHPEAALRRRAAEGDERALGLAPWELLAVGATAVIACSIILVLGAGLVGVPTYLLGLITAVRWLFAVPVGVVLGLAGWRLAGPGGTGGGAALARAGLAVAAGLIAGRLATPFPFGLISEVIGTLLSPAGLTLLALTAAAMIAVPAWAAWCAALRRATAGGGARPTRWPLLLTMCGAVLIVYAWASFWVMPGAELVVIALTSIAGAARETVRAAGMTSPLEVLPVAVAMSPPALRQFGSVLAGITTILVCCLPLLLAVTAGRKAHAGTPRPGGPEWPAARPGGPEPEGAAPPRDGAAPVGAAYARTAAVHAAAGGGAAAAVALVPLVALRALVPGQARQDDAFALLTLCLQVCVVLLAQLVTAAVSARRLGRGGAAASLFAGFAAGMVALLGMTVWSSLSGCLPPLTLRAPSCDPAAALGFLGAAWRLALPMGVVAAALGSALGSALGARFPLAAGALPAASRARAALASWEGWPRVPAGAVTLGVVITLMAPLLPVTTGPDRRDHLALFPLPSAPVAQDLPQGPEGVETWLAAGGRRHLRALAEALRDAFNAGNDGDVVALRTATSQLAGAVSAARAFPAVPDAGAQAAWASGVGHAEEALGYYQAFLQDPSGGFVDPIAHVTAALSITELVEANGRIEAATR